MKKVKYKKLIVQNFLSIGNDSIEIDFHKGFNLITGKNIDNPERNNAVGKSSLMSAYFYALFGETIGKIKNEYIINQTTRGKGRIELHFDVETTTGTTSYKIIRQIKPSKVELWRGEEDITRDSITNTNKYICELLGTNPVIHRSCDIMTLSDTTPFMLKTAPDKRKFIEDIFGIEIFGLMLKDLKKLITENKGQMNLSSAVLDEINATIKTSEEQLAAIKRQNEERDAILANRKQEIETKLSVTQTKLDELPPVINIAKLEESVKKFREAVPKLNVKITEFSTKSIELSKDLKFSNAQLAKLSSVEDVECEKCLQKVTHDHIQHINSKKEEEKEKIVKLNEEIIVNSKELRNWEDKKQKIEANIGLLLKQIQNAEEVERKRASYNQLITEYTESLNNLDQDIQTSSFSIDSFVESIENLKNKQETQQTALKECKTKESDYDICKFVLGEEGVKSFVIKKLLEMLNSTIQTYIRALGMNIKCKFDEYFDEQISNGTGKLFSYNNLSGAEKRSVDIACVLSFSDMRRKISGVLSNLEFYDEIFDSAFDERGLDLLISVLKDRIEKNGVSIYAISHRKETVKHVDGEIINLEKENSITRRVK